MALFAWYGFRLYHRRTLEKLKASEFKPEWASILQNNLALYQKLPAELRCKLHSLIHVFLHEKDFSGYGGLEITEEIRLTIAAQACMLMLNRDEDLYPSLKNIYVYPDVFMSEQTRSDGFVQTTEKVTRIGESWHLGHVVLSWKHSKQGGRDEDDGHNVVYHEFAHQLDHADGAIDGTPVLDSSEDYKDWRRVFSNEFDRLRENVTDNKVSLIDPYGAVSEGEFFAVVTELFFERPGKFSKKHPELYAVLCRYYHLNPHEWL